MLYPKKDEGFSPSLFQNPGAEYRGAPFWAWNGDMNRQLLEEQIKIFKKMGLGGFHMHVRTGLSVPYLGEEFLGLVRFCVEKAEEMGLRAYLYDEDRWPSGTAGGKVTRGRPQYARKTLMLTPFPYEPDFPHRNLTPEPGRGQESVRNDNGVLLAVYDVVLAEDGCLLSARRIGEKEQAQGVKWYAYCEHAAADPWFNGESYVDTLNPQAIREFLSTTHEAYKEAVGGHFGGAVPGIFTDEPQFAPKEALGFPREQRDVFLSWTDALPQLYKERYGEDLLDVVPELLWELPGGKLSRARWRYQDLVTGLFCESYGGQLGKWCRENDLLLLGHVMGEPTLESQAQAVGDAMRCYPDFGLPGVDMLCDFHEYTSVKQAQSMARQMGAEGVLSELYGVTGWDCDFRTYKLQGDWQAALGVTLRVPHLSWLTMKGEAKRDYPASIGYQSPWWGEFSLIEDHFARLGTALTRGTPQVSVAVVHPIESYWLHWGPHSQTAGARAQMEAQFSALCETLLFGGIDFDYLCEARLPQQCEKPGFPLRVGPMAYRVVIVPPVRGMRRSTADILSRFLEDGGRVLFLGPCPDIMDGEESREALALFDKAEHPGFDGEAILAALEPQRFLDMRWQDGRRTDRLLYQLRQEGDTKWLFICNGKNPESPDVDPAPTLWLTLRGRYALEELDTQTGEIRPLGASYEEGRTVLERVWHMHDSLLLRLTPGAGPQLIGCIQAPRHAPSLLLEPVAVTLSEPNMLLLDMGEWALNGGAFSGMEEILRIDNLAREKLGIPLRRKEVVQPYLLPKDEPKDFLRIRFPLESGLALTGTKLALEDPGHTEITLNGRRVESAPDGWFVDRCIKTVPLPPLCPGQNLLEVKVPIGPRTNLEAFYLLGDFSVWVSGCEKRLGEPVRALSWGDIVHQGLPFYTGCVTYCCQVRTGRGAALRVPQYRGALVKAFLDGEEIGPIAFSPYALTFPARPGRHTLELRLYGTRQNGFGQLHHTQGVYFYQSPNSWRSGGDLWSYEYRPKPMGILKSPELYGGSFLWADGTEHAPSGVSEGMEERS